MRYVVKKPLWPYVLDVNSPQAPGLVGWYPGDPSGGGKLFDLSGRQRNMTLFGTVPTRGFWSPGNDGGNSINLDGSTNYAAVASTLVSTPPFTLSAWFKSATTAATQEVMSLCTASGTSLTGAYANILLNSSGTLIQGQYRNDALTANLFGTAQWVANKWTLVHFVVVTAANFKLYVNGMPAGTDTTDCTGAFTVDTVAVGSLARLVAANFFSGNIEGTRIVNYAMSAPEIFSQYDPATRWSLRYQLGKTRHFIGSTTPAVQNSGMFLTF